MPGEFLTKYNSMLKHWVLQPSPNEKTHSLCFRQDAVTSYQAVETVGSLGTLGLPEVPSVRPFGLHL